MGADDEKNSRLRYFAIRAWRLLRASPRFTRELIWRFRRQVFDRNRGSNGPIALATDRVDQRRGLIVRRLLVLRFPVGWGSGGGFGQFPGAVLGLALALHGLYERAPDTRQANHAGGKQADKSSSSMRQHNREIIRPANNSAMDYSDDPGPTYRGAEAQ